MQTVLDQIKENMVDNFELSFRLLLFKLAVLFALTSASQSLGIHNLGIACMSRSTNEYKFTINKSSKTWRKGKKNPIVAFDKLFT